MTMKSGEGATTLSPSMTKPNISATMGDVVLLKNFFFGGETMSVVRTEIQALTAEDRKELAAAIRATITDRP